MKMRVHYRRAALAAISLLLLCSVALADPPAVERTIDLAQPLNTDWSIPDGATITLKLINKVPQQNYDIQLQKYTLNPAALDTTNTFKPPAPVTPPGAVLPPLVGAAAACTTLATRMDNLLRATERTVAANVRSVEDVLQAASDGNCSNVPAARTLMEETQQTILISELFPSIGADEGVLVTITRMNPISPEQKPPSPWVLDIHSGIGNGRFLTNYTFGFALNRDKSYFAKGSGTDFKIAEQVKRDKATMVPMVLFSFLDRKKAATPTVFSWTAGLGYDLSNPVVAIGGIVTWNRNIGVSFGLLGQKQQRLKGKYHVGDPIAANTESKDLTEASWGPNVFLGVNIRSVSALFK